MAMGSSCTTGKHRSGERPRFESSLLELSVRFVHLPPDKVDSEIEDGLRCVCDVLGVDRAAVWHGSHHTGEGWGLTHLYQQPDHVTLLQGPDGVISPRGGWTVQRPKTPPHRNMVELPEFFPWVARRALLDQVVAID